MADNESTEKIIIDFQTNADEQKKSVDSLNASINVTVEENENLSNSQAGVAKSSKAQVAAIEEIAPASTNAVKSLVSMGKAMWALVANPLGLVLTAIAAVIGILFLAFRSFQPLVDKVEQSFAALGAVVNVIKNTFVGLVTGTKSLGEAFSGLGGEISEAADRTMELVKAQQDLEDVMASQEVITARNRAEINKLNVALKNRTLSEEERLKISDQIVKKENEDFLQRKALVDQEVRNAREAIAIKAQFTKEEIDLLKRTGDATKELAESRGGNFDEEYKALNNARKKAIALEDESTVALEKQYAKQDKIAEELAAKREKREADQEKKRQERREREKKAQEALDAFNKLIADKEGALLKQIQDANAKTEQEKLDLQKARDAQELEALKKKGADVTNLLAYNQEIYAAKQAEIDQANLDAKIKAENDLFVADADAAEKRGQRDKEISDAMIAQKQAEQTSLENLANAGLNAAKDIFGKNKAIQKGVIATEGAVALGKVAINTVEAVSKDNAASPLTFGLPWSGVHIATGILGASSIIANTSKALKAVGGGSAPTGGDSGLTTRSAVGATPQAGFQASNENQIATSISQSQIDSPPVKAYVVSSDVTTQQNLDAKIVKDNSFG